MRRLFGIVDVPALAAGPSVGRGLATRGLRLWTPAEVGRAGASLPADAVILLQDAFTTFYEPEVVLAAVDLVAALGHTPVVLQYAPNGKALHVKGFLRRFGRRVAKNVAALAPVAALGRPIVGVDPAVVLTWRDEYPAALGPGAPVVPVQLLQEWLAGRSVAALPAPAPASGGSAPGSMSLTATPRRAPYRLFAHCTERTAVSHTERLWRDAFAAMGLELEVVGVGCCGMSGFYGHEADHATESRGIFEASWARHLPDAADIAARARVLATGYSCRSQVERCAGFTPRHPAEVLVEHLRRRR